MLARLPEALPDALTHLVAGYLIASRVVRPGYALLAFLVALLPDVDVLLGVHRWYTHSAFVVAVTSIATLVAVAMLRPRLLRATAALCLALASHVVLDLFTSYTPVLWPLSEGYYMIRVEVTGLVARGTILGVSPSVAVASAPPGSAAGGAVEGPLATGLGVALAVVAAAATILERSARKGG